MASHFRIIFLDLCSKIRFLHFSFTVGCVTEARNSGCTQKQEQMCITADVIDDDREDEEIIPTGSTVQIIEHHSSGTSKLPLYRQNDDEAASRNQIYIAHDSIFDHEEEEEPVMVMDGSFGTSTKEEVFHPDIRIESSTSLLHPALLQDHAPPRRRSYRPGVPAILRRGGSSSTNKVPPVVVSLDEESVSSGSLSTSPFLVITPTKVFPSASGTGGCGQDQLGNCEDSLDVTAGSSQTPTKARKCILEPLVLSDKTFGCPYCPKQYKLKDSCESHIKVHEGNENTCQLCGQTMSRQRDLKRHYGHVHKKHWDAHTGLSDFPPESESVQYPNSEYSQTVSLL